MSNLKKYKTVEKALCHKIKVQLQSEIELNDDDFKDGKLSSLGYKRLKAECEYIDYRKDIEFVVPKENERNFIDSLENMVVSELARIKKDQSRTRITAFIFLVIGAVWFAIGQAFPDAIVMLKEITLIATWVFIWAAFEKWFFEGHRLKDKKFSLLQILAAEVKTAGSKKEENQL